MNALRGWIGRAAVPALLLVAGAGTDARAGAAAPTPGTTAARFEASAAEALAAAARPAGVDALMRLSQQVDALPADVYAARLAAIAAAPHAHPSVAVLAAFLQAHLLYRTGGRAAAEPRFATQGFVQDWSVVGPFDDEGRKGFDTAYPPEAELLDPAILDHTYDGKERPVSWHPAQTHAAKLGLERWLYPTANTCGYAYAVARAPRAVDARVWAGADGSVTVWVGGRRAIADARYFGAFPDRFAADVRLPAGATPLLVKACGERGSLGLYLRLTDRAGRPLRGVTVEARLRDGEQPAAPASDPTAYETAYVGLARQAEADDATAEQRLEAGRTLYLSNMVDATDNEAEKLLERAVADQPTAEGYYWLMMASTDAVKAARASDEVARLAGGQAYLLAEAAARSLTTRSVRSADPIVQRAAAAPGGADDPTVTLVRALVFQNRGLAGSCSALLAQWLADHAAVPLVLKQQRTCLLAEGRVEDARAVAQALERADRSDAGFPLQRLQLLAARGETDAARALAASIADEFPDDLGTLQQVAGQLQAAGAGDAAVALLRQLSDQSPQDPGLALALGRTLEALGRRDEAIEPYRHALELEPQNQPLSQYLDFLDDRKSIEERWAVDAATLADGMAADRAALAAAAPDAQAALRKGRDLFRQEVDQILPNGLSSRFGQWFTLVQTEDGAQQSRHQEVPYTPSEEDFELLRAIVYKPDGHTEDYEAHYPISYGGSSYFSDAGAEQIAFPRLGVGDVIEVRYRIDGRSRQNKFGEHFSNEVGVLDFQPTDRFRYVLVAPASKALYVHTPEDLGFTADEQTTGDEKVRTYEATDLPAIPEEPNAPPYSELSRAIQVSTFRDWHELARWWWGLVKDQLQPDEAIRARVREITAGATGTDEIVARIFDWVIRNTRYVALEFGIHGWKPYRAHEVVSRGFGDCKDKASLIYTMLAAAGVDARLVLLRSRYYRGAPVSEFPSLGQFDHLIAYVPALDLFVDGTVTMAADTELPAMDRGAFGVIVGPNDERTVILPLEPHAPDLLDDTFAHDVRADGSSTVHGTIEATGAYAPGIRGALQAAETRRQRAEEAVGHVYAGFVLGDFSVEGLDDYRVPVVVHADGTVPQLAGGGGGSFSMRADRPLDLASTWAAADRRQLDVEMGQATHESREIAYRLPSGVQDVRLPEGRELHDGGRSFTMATTRNGDEVHVTWRLVIPDPRIPVADYASFRAFCAAVDTALAEPITYVTP